MKPQSKSKYNVIKFNKKKFINKKFCVLCNSINLKTVLDFGKTPLANSYPKKIFQKELTFLLKVKICKKCGHLQLSQIVNPSLMFDNYLYVSGTSKVLVKHFEDYSKKIIKLTRGERETKILDIACNDGTFLNFFKNKFDKVVGIDPAKNLKNLNLKKNIDIISDYFSMKTSKKIKKKFGKFNVITANNVFAHNPNLQDFTQGVKNLMEPKGFFVLEVSYLPVVLKKKTFDTIYHEHMSYHSLKPLVSFFKKFKLEIFDFELISAQGGSIRIFVANENQRKVKKRKINNQIKKENLQKIYEIKTYQNFYRDIQYQKNTLRKLINELNSKKKTIIGYGAPAKLTTLSHVLDFNYKDFKIVIDDNNLKQNRYVPGTKFLIRSSKFLTKKDNSTIIILAWNFFKSIRANCLKINKNFDFIKPFPFPRKTK